MKAFTEIGQNAAFLVLLPFFAAALATDVSRRRIPNLLIAYMLGCGVVVQAVLFGPSGLLHAFGGSVIGLVMLLPFYALGGMGAGDVKLLAAAGTFLGPDGALLAGALTLGAGGLLAVAAVAWHILARLVRRRLPSARVAAEPIVGVTSLELPYSIAIAAGSLIAAYGLRVDPLSSWGSP